MEIYGIIGEKLDHSFSPVYFQEKFQKLNADASYHKYELDNLAELPELIHANKDLLGVNVTVPFKEQIIPYLDVLSADANLIGAVNTIKVVRNKERILLKGYNTDIIGFQTALTPYVSKKHDIKALILGSGGSAKAVKYALQKMHIQFKTVSRKPAENALSYSDIDKSVVSEYQLIINTTPLGMYPVVNSSPDIPYHLLSHQHILFDLVYNPLKTQFLAKGEKQHATVVNGLKMLHIQADESWKIWQDKF